METKTPTAPIQATVKLSDITIGGSNPRKEFDEESILELAASIKEQGVLQPILLRPKGDKYELVCGERRYRASKLVQKEIAGRDEIPAIIRELTDEAALELMIIENLQRKDVHPMEEANAFAALIKIRKFDAEEIARRVGKSKSYVTIRLKLNDLTKEFQKTFYQNKLSLKDAIVVCKLSNKTQQELWNEEQFEHDNKINIYSNTLKNYMSDLNDAPFDTKDPSLSKDFGACTNCIHNSASNSSLFPEEEHKATCLNSPCFRLKANSFFNSELIKVLQDPTIELISDEYNFGKKANELIKKGHKVIGKGYNGSNYTVIEKPEAPDLVEFEERLDDGDFDDTEEMKKEYAAAIVDYNEELEEYQKKINSGRYIKSFVIEGNDQGKYIYVTLKKNSGSAAKKGSAAPGDEKKETKVTAAEINNEIERIKANEKRKKELDHEKIQPLVYEVLKKDKAYPVNKKPLTHTEKCAQIIMMLEYAGHQAQRDFAKVTKVKLEWGKASCFDFLMKENQSFIDGAINMLTRHLVIDKMEPSNGVRPETSNKASALLEIVDEIHGKEVARITDAQMEERENREARVADKIAALKKQLNPKKEKPAAITANGKRGLSALLNKNKTKN